MFKQTSKQPSGYMQQLDQWIDEQVIEPLFEVWETRERVVGDPEDEASVEKEVEQTVTVVRKALREKILESYHNGQAARPKPGGERRRYGAR